MHLQEGGDNCTTSTGTTTRSNNRGAAGKFHKDDRTNKFRSDAVQNAMRREDESSHREARSSTTTDGGNVSARCYREAVAQVCLMHLRFQHRGIQAPSWWPRLIRLRHPIRQLEIIGSKFVFMRRCRVRSRQPLCQISNHSDRYI